MGNTPKVACQWQPKAVFSLCDVVGVPVVGNLVRKKAVINGFLCDVFDNEYPRIVGDVFSVCSGESSQSGCGSLVRKNKLNACCKVGDRSSVEKEQN